MVGWNVAAAQLVGSNCICFVIYHEHVECLNMMNVACFMSMNTMNVLNELYLLLLQIALCICKCFMFNAFSLFMFMGLDFLINNSSVVSHIFLEGRGRDRCVALNFLFSENRQTCFLRPKPLIYSFKLVVQNFYQDNNLSIMCLALYLLFICQKF